MPDMRLERTRAPMALEQYSCLSREAFGVRSIPNWGGIVGAGHLDRNCRSGFLFLEERIEGLQQRRFYPGRCLRELAFSLQGTVKVDSLIQQVVGAVHVRRGARNGE